MAKFYMALLLLFGALLALTAVQSKTLFDEHGEMTGESEDEQESENMDQLSDVNQDSDENKRTYKPVYRPVYYPRFSCGNDLYSPRNEVCCCGKKYTRKWRVYGYKKVQWRCCGYKYYDGYYNKCCPFFTVLSKKHKCPRHKM